MEKQSRTSKQSQPKAAALTGVKPQARESRPPLQRLRSALGNQAFGRVMQAKLQISQPGDEYEQEADRVAAQIMRMPVPTGPGAAVTQHSSTLSLPQRQCAQCGEAELQRQTKESGAVESAEPAPLKSAQNPASDNSLATRRAFAAPEGGQPLPAAERAFFEPCFGMDFSQVRVHADAQATAAARGVNAQAYTLGANIVFDAGKYAPGTAAGRELLAHELTHVVQQGVTARLGDGLRISRQGASPVLQRTIREGHDHAGRYEIDDQTCAFTYHQNWYFAFRTSQTPEERAAYMEAARQQVEGVWSGRFPLLPEQETGQPQACPCPAGLTVAVRLHPHEGERRGRGYSVVVSPEEARGWTIPPNRQIDLGQAHDQPVDTGQPAGQQRIAHEFGHTIGLTDEYPEWAQFFRTEGSRDAAAIMHSGDEVRPRHYQPFADIVNQEMGGCTYRPAGRRMPEYENPAALWRPFPFTLSPDSAEFIIGLNYDRRLGNEAWLGLIYPTAGVMSVWNPATESIQTGPTLGLRLNQIAHPLYVNVHTGLLIDPAGPLSAPDLRLPVAAELGIRQTGFEAGVSYTGFFDLLHSGEYTHIIGLNLQLDLP